MLLTDQQRAKGKPFLRLVCGPSIFHMFELDTEADRDALVDAVAKVPNVMRLTSGIKSNQLCIFK